MITILQVTWGKCALESGSMNWQKLLCFRVSIDSGIRLKLRAASCREAGGCFSHSGSLARIRVNQTMKARGKPLLSLCLLTFHQPKQITWTSPKLMGRKYHTSHHENMVRVWMSIIDEWRIDIRNSTYHVTHSQKCYWYFLLMAETFIRIIFSYEIIQKQEERSPILFFASNPTPHLHVLWLLISEGCFTCPLLIQSLVGRIHWLDWSALKIFTPWG